MQKTTFLAALAECKNAGFNATLVLKSVSSRGCYSSGQTTIIVPPESILVDNFLIIPLPKKKDKYNPFSAAETFSGGERMYIDYDDVLCVIAGGDL